MYFNGNIIYNDRGSKIPLKKSQRKLLKTTKGDIFFKVVIYFFFYFSHKVHKNRLSFQFCYNQILQLSKIIGTRLTSIQKDAGMFPFFLPCHLPVKLNDWLSIPVRSISVKTRGRFIAGRAVWLWKVLPATTPSSCARPSNFRQKLGEQGP